MKVKVFQLRLTTEYLQIDQDSMNNFLDNVIVKKTSTELITGQTNYWSILVFYDELITEKSDKSFGKILIANESDLNEEEVKTFKILKQWRYDLATHLNIPSYMICNNSELIAIAKERPRTLDELSKIKGFGTQKTAKFGNDIIAVLNSI